MDGETDDVGAVVAVEPSDEAGEVERIGEEMDEAESVPGTVWPPCSGSVRLS